MKTRNHLSQISAMLFALVALPANAYAQNGQFTGNPITDGIISTIIYSGIGMFMAFVSYKVVDMVTPGDLGKDIAQNPIALAILAGLTILGICIIIAASIAG